MEVPKDEPFQATVRQARHGSRSGIRDLVRFFGETKQEVRRISWPTHQELRTSTKVVLSAMLLSGFVLYGVDLVLQGAFHSLNILSLWLAS